MGDVSFLVVHGGAVGFAIMLVVAVGIGGIPWVVPALRRWEPKARAKLRRRAAVGGIVISSVSTWSIGEIAWRADAYDIAAASPFKRTRSVSWMRYLAKGDRTLQGRRRLDRLTALDRVLGDCNAEAAALSEHGQWRRAADRFVACGTPAARLHAGLDLFTVGAFQEASDLFDGANDPSRGLFHALAHLLAGQPARAANAAEAYARWLEGDQANAKERAAPEDVDCVVLGLRARAGDAEGLRRLRESSRETCRVLLADMSPLNERSAILEPLVHAATAEIREQRHRRSTLLLLVESGVMPAIEGNQGTRPLLSFADEWKPTYWPPVEVPNSMDHRPLTLLDGPGFVRPIGLERALLAQLANEPSPSGEARSLRRNLAGFEALFELAAGRTQEARRWADMAKTDSLDLFPEKELGQLYAGRSLDRLMFEVRSMAIDVLIALREGDRQRAKDTLAPWQSNDEALYIGPAAPTEGADAESARRTRELAWGMLELSVIPMVAQLLAIRDALEGHVVEDRALQGPIEPRCLGFGRVPQPTCSGEAWKLAADGDGLALARWMAEQNSRVADPVLLLGADGLKSGKAELAELLQYGTYDRRRDTPYARLAGAGMTADIARRLGAAAFAEEEDAVAKRFYEALVRREYAVPLAVIQRL